MSKTTSQSTQKYAVIQVAGHQYKVTEGEVITVDRLESPENKPLVISDVLLVSDGSKIQVGAPLLEKAKVTCEVVSHQKDDKIRVATFKAKSRYRKVRGHRQAISVLRVTSIAA